jgi:hypothetical protein
MPTSLEQRLRLLELEEAEYQYQKQKKSTPQPSSDEPILNRVGKGLLGGVQYVGEKIDRYAGAPSRRGLMNVLEGEGVGGYLGGFKEQFGKNPGIAPTDSEIGEKLGFGDTALSDVLPKMYSETGEGLALKKGGLLDPTAKGTAGFVASAASDPTTYLPIGPMAKGITKAASTVVKPVAKLASKSGGVIKNAAIKTGALVGSTISGVPRELVENYMRRTNEINSRIAKYGDDLATASDDVRRGFQTQIQNTRMGLNKGITDTLANNAASYGPNKVLSVDPVLKSLEQAKSKLNKTFDKDQISQIDELIARIQEVAPLGATDPLNFYQLSQHLNEMSSGAYQKSGQIFVPGKAVQRAAKAATRDTRSIIAKELPEIAAANKEMARLHQLESLMNKNLIAPGKPEGALMAAGATRNRGRKVLEDLGEITGSDMATKAKDLATQREFTKPGLLPSGPQTGYALLRPAVGGLLGSAVGGPVATAIGAAFMSPLALKTAINAGKIPIEMIQAISGRAGKITDAMLDQVVKVANGPNGDQIIRGAYMATMGAVRQGEERE